MNQPQSTHLPDRRAFIKSSAIGLTALAGAIPLRGAAASDRLGWESVMGEPWEKPPRLHDFAGVHPRLFVNRQRIEQLRTKIRTTHRTIWESVKEKADGYVGQMPPSNFDSESDMRSAGRGIPWQAVAFLLTDESKYLENAKKWVLTICEFPRWENNKSLAAGECLFGVAIGYDWLHAQFSEEERNRIREKLTLQAEVLKSAPTHHEVWLANHNHVEHNGLATAGFALFDEVPNAVEWIRQADLVFRQTLKTASGDGSSNEGHQYWAYTTEAILRYLELARDLLGKDYYNSAWLKRVPDFIIDSTLPDFNAQNCVMTFGDSGRTFSSHGPTHILYRLAAEYGDRSAQGLALEMQRRNIGRGDYCTWASLLWYDDTLPGEPVSARPMSGHAEDVGWVTARSTWAANAVMVGFKCGPMHGHKVQAYYDRQYDEKWPKFNSIGGGHGHPDVNSFQVYAYGKWLAIDPGYEKPKPTASHNTLLVNGHGQLGEGETWFDRNTVLKARASSGILKVTAERDYVYALGDARNIYPADLGLTRFHRHFLFLRPDLIVLVDDVRAERDCTVDWLLHTEEVFTRKSDRAFLATNGDVEMDVELLLPVRAETRLERKSLKFSAAVKRHAYIVAILHPRRKGAPSIGAQVDFFDSETLSIEVLRAGLGKKIHLDLKRQDVTILA